MLFVHPSVPWPISYPPYHPLILYFVVCAPISTLIHYLSRYPPYSVLCFSAPISTLTNYISTLSPLTLYYVLVPPSVPRPIVYPPYHPLTMYYVLVRPSVPWPIIYPSYHPLTVYYVLVPPSVPWPIIYPPYHPLTLYYVLAPISTPTHYISTLSPYFVLCCSCPHQYPYPLHIYLIPLFCFVLLVPPSVPQPITYPPYYLVVHMYCVACHKILFDLSCMMLFR